MSSFATASAAPSAASSATPASTSAAAAATPEYRMPNPETLQNAVRLAIKEDRPIIMDYWTASIDKTATIGIGDDGTKLLVKSITEYTSTIQKIFKVKTDYIVMTENSIYLIDGEVTPRRIDMKNWHNE